MKFGKQLLLIFIAATAAPLLVLWFSLGEMMYKKEVADVSAKQLLIARNLGSALQRYHADVKSGFEIVSKNLVADSGIKNVNNFIASLNFRHFCVANIQSGRVVAQAAPKTTPCPEQIPAERMAFFKALANDTEPVFSPVLAGPENQPLIYVLQKFGNKLAIAAVSTNYIVELGKAVTFGQNGHAAIVDQGGNILAHPNSKWVATRKNISGISVVKSMMAGQTGVTTFFSPALEAEVIAGFTNVSGTGWGVMVPQPTSELQLAAKAAHNAIFPIIAICIVLAGLLALLIARRVMKPLNSMIKLSEAVDQGDRHPKPDVDDSWHVPHEFKDVQKRFNAMAKAVSKYQDNQQKDRQAAETDRKNKAEYFANLAHELKTPLNSILGFSGVLRQAAPGSLEPHEKSEFLGHIEKSAGHLLLFVNDLLDLNRLEMGAHKISEQEFRLIDPIRFCETMLRKQIDNKKISVVIDCEDKNLRLFADERSINQILINLVGNAVRYSFDEGEIKISTRLLAGGDLQIKVLDHGIGIPKDDLEVILLPFKRANDPHLAEIHGTGLGLSIVSKLARLHNFTFTIESVHGFSTTARLVIPKERIMGNPANTEVA